MKITKLKEDFLEKSRALIRSYQRTYLRQHVQRLTKLKRNNYKDFKTIIFNEPMLVQRTKSTLKKIRNKDTDNNNFISKKFDFLSQNSNFVKLNLNGINSHITPSNKSLRNSNSKTGSQNEKYYDFDFKTIDYCPKVLVSEKKLKQQLNLVKCKILDNFSKQENYFVRKNTTNSPSNDLQQSTKFKIMKLCSSRLKKKFQTKEKPNFPGNPLLIVRPLISRRNIRKINVKLLNNSNFKSRVQMLKQITPQTPNFGEYSNYNNIFQTISSDYTKRNKLRKCEILFTNEKLSKIQFFTNGLNPTIS